MTAPSAAALALRIGDLYDAINRADSVLLGLDETSPATATACRELARLYADLATAYDAWNAARAPRMEND